MLTKYTYQLLQPVAYGATNNLYTTAARRIIPINNKEFRYLRFRAIGSMECDGSNGNWDGFPYEHFEDSRPNYGYKSFIGKRAHVEHNSSSGIAGSIGDLPDAFLNRFSIPTEFGVQKYADLLGRNNDNKRLAVLGLPNQTDGSIDVLMRIDVKLASDTRGMENKSRRTAERIVRMIDTGQRLACSMGCFVRGTPIQLSNGIQIPIENVRIGDMILTHSGQNKPVIDTMVRYESNDMYRISVFGIQKSTVVTGEHPYLVLRSRPLCACGCGGRVQKKNERWLLGHWQNVFNTNPLIPQSTTDVQVSILEDAYKEQLEWIEVSEISKHDYVAFPLPVQKSIETPHITEGKARLIGYFLAEGSYIKHTYVDDETLKVGVEFNFGNTDKDKEYVTEVKRRLVEEFEGVIVKEYLQKKYRNVPQGCISLRVNSKSVAQFFDFYCGEYSNKKQLHEEVFQWSSFLQKHLLAAYFNGDGCQSMLGGVQQITFASTVSEVLARQLHYLLLMNRIPASLTKQHYVYQKSPVYILTIRGHWQNVLNEFWSYKTHDGTSTSLFRIEGDYLLMPVRSIERVRGGCEVFNLTVQDDNSYVAGGMTVHNCNIEYSVCSVCGNVSHFAHQYCDHIKNRKGAITVIGANQVRDLMDSGALRPEWLQHVLVAKRDREDVLKGYANRSVAMRNVELNHVLSFFELSIVANPAFPRAWQLEKYARQSVWQPLNNSRWQPITQIEWDKLSDDDMLRFTSEATERGLISTACTLR